MLENLHDGKGPKFDYHRAATIQFSRPLMTVVYHNMYVWVNFHNGPGPLLRGTAMMV